jgi:hypothetical protein
VSGTFSHTVPKFGHFEVVGLIYQRRKVHGAFATDSLSLIKLPKTCHTLPVLSIIITSRPLKKGPLLQQSQSVFTRVNPRLMWNIPFHWWGKPHPTPAPSSGRIKPAVQRQIDYGGASPTLPDFCVCRRGISGRLVRSRVACWINGGFITQYALRNTRYE